MLLISLAKVSFGRWQEFSVPAFWFRREVRPWIQRRCWWWVQKPWSSWRFVAESYSNCVYLRMSSERKTRGSLCLCVCVPLQSAVFLLRLFAFECSFMTVCTYLGNPAYSITETGAARMVKHASVWLTSRFNFITDFTEEKVPPNIPLIQPCPEELFWSSAYERFTKCFPFLSNSTASNSSSTHMPVLNSN